MGLHAASRRLRHVSRALGPPQPPSASPTAGAGQEQEEPDWLQEAERRLSETSTSEQSKDVSKDAAQQALAKETEMKDLTHI